MIKELLDSFGLKTLLLELAKHIATKKAVAEVKTATDPFILDVDYSMLKFNTDFIVTGDATSHAIGVGQVGALVIAES